MLELRRTTAFKQDYKLALRRRNKIQLLEVVLQQLLDGVPLEERYRNHGLKGRYVRCWECHLAPDWLLIYQTTATHLILHRLGTHADLFE